MQVFMGTLKEKLQFFRYIYYFVTDRFIQQALTVVDIFLKLRVFARNQ